MAIKNQAEAMPGRRKCRWNRILLFGAGGLIAVAGSASLVLFFLFTASAPLDLPGVPVPREAEDALIGRWMDFQDALHSGEPAAPFRFSSEDFNAFASMMPRLRSRVCAKIEKAQLHCQYSSPLWTGRTSRYFNGMASIKVSLRNGELQILVTSCQVNGHALPRWLCRQLGRKEFNPEAYWVMDEFRILPHLKSVEMQDDCILLVPRGQQQPP